MFLWNQVSTQKDKKSLESLNLKTNRYPRNLKFLPWQILEIISHLSYIFWNFCCRTKTKKVNKREKFLVTIFFDLYSNSISLNFTELGQLQYIIIQSQMSNLVKKKSEQHPYFGKTDLWAINFYTKNVKFTRKWQITFSYRP